ncbi:MAG TPA: phosphotransferase family protein [Candidatus Kryptonia bacterium]|nr:phosphotransferase family protein [Candidatus Kryptonia bacterium]
MDRERLRDYLAARVPAAGDVVVNRLERTGGGASRETWLIDAEWTEAGERLVRRLIIRRDPTASLLESDRRTEFQVLCAAGKIGIPVPQMYWLEEDPRWLDRPFMVMERLPGVAPPVVVPLTESEATRRALAEQFVAHLARIHRADWDALGLHFLGVPASGHEAARTQLAWWEREYHRQKLEERPVLATALHWLASHLPERSEIVLVHADYRAGNFLYEGDRITAILDWEMAHLGDPMEDLAWAVLKFYSTGDFCQGLLTHDEMVAAYTRAGGMAVDLDRLFFYEVLGAVKMAVICLTGVRSFCEARTCETVNALVGLMVPRLEADLIDKLQI